MEEKLSEKKWFIALLCILFFPVGLYLLWTKGNFSKKGKIIITAIVSVLVIAAATGSDSDKNQENNNIQADNENSQSEKVNVNEVKEEKEVKETKKEEPEPKKGLSDLDPQDMLDNTRFKVNINAATNYFIEEYEKQKIKKISNKTVAVYSKEVVHDQAGTEFPYSFMITGRYEEKGTGALKDFVMTLAFKDDKQLEDGLASCVQYINDDTGNNINVMKPEDDVLLKIMNMYNDNN